MKTFDERCPKCGRKIDLLNPSVELPQAWGRVTVTCPYCGSEVEIDSERAHDAGVERGEIDDSDPMTFEDTEE